MPFLLPLLPAIIAGGGAAAAAASGRAAGRASDAKLQMEHDQLANQGARLNLEAPGMRARTSVQGDILSNAKDFAYGAPSMVGNIPVPSSTGGLRPSIFSDSTKKLGALQSAQALTGAQTNGGNVASNTPLPQPGLFDKILGWTGTVGGLAGGAMDGMNGGQPDFNNFLAKYRRKPPTNVGDFPASGGDWANA